MKRFNNILYVFETGETSKAALERAVTLAENNQADLTAIVVAERVTAGIGMPAGGPISADLQAGVVSDHGRRLAALVEPYRKRVEIKTKVLTGTPFLEIIREVLHDGSDLVIKTPETWDWLDHLISSDDMHLLRKCPCPVWLVKSGAPKSYRRILAAVDLNDDYPSTELATRRGLNQQIVELACSLALSDFAELHIVHVWEAIGETVMRKSFVNVAEEEIAAYVEEVESHNSDRMKDIVREVTSRLGPDVFGYLKPRTHLVKGWARKEVPELAGRIEADLIVMGTVARTGVPGFFMGNTAETILNQIDCSVLAIKPPGFRTPVTVRS